MAFIPVPNVVQAELVFTWNGQICQNVLHYLVDEGVDPTIQAGIGADLAAWFDDSMQPLVVDTLSLIEVRLSDLTSEFAPGASWSGGLPLVGSLAGGLSMPNNVSIVMTKRTDFRGRSFRGRIYHVGLSENQVTANNIVPATLTSLLAAYAELMTVTVGAETYPLCVVSRYQGGEPRVTGIATPVTAITSDGIVDSQRRRLPGRGS